MRHMYIYDNISLNFRRMNISEKFMEKIKIHGLYLVTSFSENNAIQEMMWKNVIQPDRSQIEILYSAEEMKEGRHTLIIFITFCFSTAALAVLKYLNITLYVHLMFSTLKCYDIKTTCQSVTQHFRFIYNKNSVLSGRHVSTFIRSSSGPLRKQIQELFIFQCIVGS